MMNREKKSFALRLDLEVYQALEKWAADEFRSVNGQIEFLLDKALRESKRIKSGAAGKTTNHKKNLN